MNDQQDRAQIRTELGVNWVVEAGAGTGKTTLLIERLCLALLAQGIAAPRLVALTFTEKAAAEIKTRLVLKLQAVLRALSTQADELILQTLRTDFSVPDDVITARAEAALAQLDRSQIGTIHSFCAAILRQYPLEAGLTPQAEIDTGGRAQRILEAYWNQFLDRELGLQAPRADRWKAVLPYISLPQLYAYVQQRCSGKIQQYDYFAQKEKLMTICRERAQSAAALARAFLTEKQKPRAIENALTQAAQRFEQAALWLQSGQLPAQKQETISIPSAAPKGWDVPVFEEAKALCHFAAQADPFVQTLVLQGYELVEELVEQVRTEYRVQGILSFDDLIVKTRDLLQQNLLVRRLLQEQYDVFYIDEFQDTDPVQGELLLFLAEQKGGGASTWQQVKLTPGKLCVVGDPKQSIYRFRGADITAYELFTQLILQQGGKKAYLRQNFRSELDIVELANEVCSQVMVEKPAFQPAYEPIFTARPAGEIATEMALITPPVQGKALADDYRHNQAQWVARWIAEHVGQMVLQNGRKLEYKDIAILSRAATTLGPYTDALRRLSIPFAVEEDRTFYTRPEITDVLNCLRVIEDPQNKIALVGVMRSPLGGLTDEEIYQAAQRGELNFYQATQLPKLARLFENLRHWAEHKGRLPLHQFLQQWLQQSWVREACAQAYEGARSITHIERFAALAQSYALQQPVTLGQFLARVGELMQQELNRLTTAGGGEAAQAVSVMSVHKSKGLEFPVVLVVDISRKEVQNASTQDDYLYSWRDNVHGFRVGKYADINLAWLEEEQREHSRCEEIRILYVALTRAREKLILVGNAVSDRGSMAGLFQRAGMFPPPQQQPLQLGRQARLQVHYVPYVNPADFIYRPAAAPQAESLQWNLDEWKTANARRHARYEQAQAPRAPLAPSKREALQAADEQALLLGTWVHAVLKRRTLFPQHSLEELVTATMPPGAAALRPVAQEMLASFWQSEVFARLSAMKVLGAEMPFSLDTPDGVVSGVIDLLAQDTAGRVWVVDYKTDDVIPGTEEQAARAYQAQLTVYAQAARRLYPSAPVQAAVVFIRTGKIGKI